MFSRLPRARRAAFLLLSAVAVGTLSACDTPSAPAIEETGAIEAVRSRASATTTDTTGTNKGGWTDPHGRTSTTSTTSTSTDSTDTSKSGWTDPHG